MHLNDSSQQFKAKTYSQVYQDVFVNKLLGDSGFFVDVGAGWREDSGLNSNTLLLEEKGWSGLCFEGYEPAAAERKKLAKRAQIICVYIDENNLKEFLIANNCPKTIDYLSIDIEPYSLTGLKAFPFNEFEFKVLTFEHDRYYLGPEQKNTSTEILKTHGYVCLCEDILAPKIYGSDSYFEDWWVNPKYFNEELLSKNRFAKQTGEYIATNLSIL